MRFVGIDSVVYRVEDMDLCHRFFDDWGLRTVKRTDDEVVFETRQGPGVVLKNLHTQDFAFPSPQAGSSLSEVVWGVASRHDLDLVAEELARDRPVERAEDGSVHSVDPFGYGIGFTVWQHASLAPTHNIDPGATRTNFVGSRTRINEPAIHYARAEPTRIGHVVFEISSVDDLRKGEAFYLERLKFSASDRYTESGLFCRCAEESDHHNIALLTTRHKRTQFEHVAFEVRDIHEVFGGGLHFSRCGWETQLGPGRHPISSAYFWYFKNPAGGLIEYYADEDQLTAEWQAREFEPGPTVFAEWAVDGGLDGNTRRQKNAEGPQGKFLTEKK
jgi:catechol-2,3-dioxygenase